jgi:CelD/BcsL family acetyltransferase involved in cellulose biosynthesis
MHGSDAVEAASQIWNELETAYGVSSPFQSLALAAVAAKAHVMAKETPRIVVVREGRRPVLLLPTVVSAKAGLSTARFLGDPLIQYGDAIAAADASIEHFEAAWSAVADPGIASAVLLRKVRQDTKIDWRARRRRLSTCACRTGLQKNTCVRSSGCGADSMRKVRPGSKFCVVGLLARRCMRPSRSSGAGYRSAAFLDVSWGTPYGKAL